MFCSSFCSLLMLGLHAHMLDIMSMVMPCLDLYVCIHVLRSYAYIRVFTCLYAWIHVLPCLCAKFLYVYMHVSMPICLCLCFHMLVCLDLCFLHVSCYFPCACVLYAMFVRLDLGYVCCAKFFLALLLLYLSFLCFGLLVRTRSRPYGGGPHYTLVHIKGFGSPILHVYACLLLCFMLVLASLVLGFATLDTLSGRVVVWLHPTPMRPYLDATT